MVSAYFCIGAVIFSVFVSPSYQDIQCYSCTENYSALGGFPWIPNELQIPKNSCGSFTDGTKNNVINCYNNANTCYKFVFTNPSQGQEVIVRTCGLYTHDRCTSMDGNVPNLRCYSCSGNSCNGASYNKITFTAALMFFASALFISKLV